MRLCNSLLIILKETYSARCYLTFRLSLGKCINQEFEISTYWVEDGASTATLLVFFHFCLSLGWRPRRGNVMNEIIGHKMFCLIDLLFGGWPPQYGLNFCNYIL